MPSRITILLNRLFPRRWLQQSRPGSMYSRFAWPRWVDYDYDDDRWRVHATQAEWRAWAREHMPNGNCICYPERGIVCGQHDPQFHTTADAPNL